MFFFGQLVTIAFSLSLACFQQFFSIDVLDFPGVACLSGMSFRNKLIFSTMLLPGAAAILAVPPLILLMRRSANMERFYHEAVEMFWFSLMFVMFSVYPSVSRVTVSTFSCLNLGTDGKPLSSHSDLGASHARFSLRPHSHTVGQVTHG